MNEVYLDQKLRQMLNLYPQSHYFPLPHTTVSDHHILSHGIQCSTLALRWKVSTKYFFEENVDLRQSLPVLVENHFLSILTASCLHRPPIFLITDIPLTTCFMPTTTSGSWIPFLSLRPTVISDDYHLHRRHVSSFLVTKAAFLFCKSHSAVSTSV